MSISEMAEFLGFTLMWTVLPAGLWWLSAKFWPDDRKKRAKKLDSSQAQLELERLRIAERREIREHHARLAQDKLEILKTAVAMGYSQQQLAELDARLATLIGDEAVAQLDSSLPTAELPAAGAAPAASRVAEG